MWHYASQQAQTLGPRGIFAGWGLSFTKDAFGYGVFFAGFEFVKSQCFYEYVSYWYGRFGKLSGFHRHQIELQQASEVYNRPVIKPHYLMEPSFILLAGLTASVLQQTIYHPLTQIQEIHYGRVMALDAALKKRPSKAETMRLYMQAYRKTFKLCAAQVRRAGSWRGWLYQDFWTSTLRQAPSTSAGLIVFEVFRRKYGLGEDEVRIEKDGYDILLP